MAKRYFVLVNMLLVAVICYFGVRIAYQFLMVRMDAGTLLAQTSKQSTMPETDVRLPQSNYDAVTSRDLFKTKAAQELADKDKIKTPEAPPMELTKLQVRLWGTVSGEGIASYAVIEDMKDKKQSLFHVNDKIQNATVKQILREKVILTQAGKDEVLEMGEKAGSPPNQPVFPPPIPVGSADPQGMPPDNIKLARTEIQDAINDVNNLMKQARIRPHFTDGKPDGLTITGVQQASIFTKLGLQSGDIITSVDGKDIQSVDDALRLYQSLKSSPAVSVQIKRKGESKNIGYSIE